MTQAQEIAIRLSEAQRKAVICAVGNIGMVPSHYPTALRISQQTLRALNRLGITERFPPRLTPLGIKVRAILQEQAANG